MGSGQEMGWATFCQKARSAIYKHIWFLRPGLLHLILWMEVWEGALATLPQSACISRPVSLTRKYCNYRLFWEPGCFQNTRWSAANKLSQEPPGGGLGLLLHYFFWDKVFHSSGWPWTCYAAEDDLPPDPHAFTSQVLPRPSCSYVLNALDVPKAIFFLSSASHCCSG